MPELARDDIEALARQVFGPKCRVLAWHSVTHGDDHAVVFATLVFPARVVVLKLADAASATCFSREAAIQQRVARETTVPVCEALAVDDSCQRFPWRYLMMAHAPGMAWRDGLKRMSPHARYDIFRQLGEATAALHSLRYPHFGEVDSESPLSPWGRGLGERADFLSALVACARRRIANPAHVDLFVTVLQAHAGDFTSLTEPRLTHEDLNPNNLLLVPGDEPDDDWRLAAVLDFGSAWAGCHESDIARLELWRDMMDDGFTEGYTASQPIAADYPKRRPIYQLLWCLEYARPTSQHHADTARVCAALGIPPVTFGG
ncbi:MAG TPA: aminoglycoside phosphotransferase family protein [Ktedonobacterales bacterium]|nr:aminoglycoside phosphotransferase family protein [Ktedonobacterales bacterium]